MIKIDRDIRSLSEFKRKTPDMIRQLEKDGRPVVLTMNGRARVVVQDAASYQKMVDVLEQAEAVEAIRESLAEARAGKAMSLADFDRKFRKMNRLPKRK